MKSKERDGALVRKTCYAPQTPYERIMASDTVNAAAKQRLQEQFLGLDPVALLAQIRVLQKTVAALADTNAVAMVNTLDVTEFLASLPDLWEHGEARPTHRIKAREARWWRTRPDPFEASWPLVKQWLESEPHITGKALMRRLQEHLPEQRMTMAQSRTLQRRVESWRTDRANRIFASIMAAHSTGAAAPVE